MRIISASIDLNKIDKSKIVNHQNGAKYYNIDIIVGDEKNKYGQDTSISEQQTKEQRAAKEKRKYLGNGKTVWEGQSKSSQGSSSPSSHEEPALQPGTANDDLPF